MKYSTTLPKQFKTWLELYDASKYLEDKQDIAIPEHENLFINNLEATIPKPTFIEINYYRFDFIKEMVLKEFLENRLDKGYINFTIGRILGATTPFISDEILKEIFEIKEHLLTQSK